MEDNNLQTPETPVVESVTPATSFSQNTQKSTGSQDNTQMVVVILTLLFFYPIGVILMWVWMKSWPKWAKILLTLPLVGGILFIVASVILLIVGGIYVAKNPEVTQEWQDAAKMEICLQSCTETNYANAEQCKLICETNPESILNTTNSDLNTDMQYYNYEFEN